MAVNSLWNAVNFRLGLVRTLRAQGGEVVVVAPPDYPDEKLAELGCRVVPLPMSQYGMSLPSEIFSLLRLFLSMRRERPDVVVTFTIKPNIYGALVGRLLGCPVVATIAGLGRLRESRSSYGRVGLWLYRLTLRSCQHVFFQNRDDYQFLLERGIVNAEISSVVPGSGVDLERFSMTPFPSAPASLGVTFLFSGRLLWAKGVGEYVAAARVVRLKRPDVIFQIAGFTGEEKDGAVSAEMMETWVKDGTVEYLGAVEDVRSSLCRASCVVLPSYYGEGTPRGLLEAAAMGRPIITTDWVGCRDAVEDGVSGFLCRPRDLDDLVEKMERFCGLSREAQIDMGVAARAKMEREFDERVVLSAYGEAVRAAVESSNRRSHAGVVGEIE